MTDDNMPDGGGAAETVETAETAEKAEKAEFEVVDGADTEADETAGSEVDESITQPSKLIRIASMIRTMLEEVRRAPLDDAGRKLLRNIHERSLTELERVLSDDLKDELAEVVLPFTEEAPSESELRLAQAQLVGWLEGLFHGIQATIFSQQMSMQQQLEEMRQRRALESGKEGRTGHYL